MDTRDARDEEVRMLCRDLAELSIQTLKEVMDDVDAKANARVAAAKIVLDRGFGAPERRVTQDVNVTVYDQRQAHFDALQKLAAKRKPLIIEDASFKVVTPQAKDDFDD